MHSCFTSCIFAARTLDFAIKFRLVFRYEAVVFRRYVLALLSAGLLRKLKAYLVYLSLIWTKNPRRFSVFQKFLHFTYMLLWFSRANSWHAQSFFSSVRHGPATNNRANSHNFKTLNWIYLQRLSLPNLRWFFADGRVKQARDWRLQLTFRRAKKNFRNGHPTICKFAF